jgi:SAM-dependent methyltransferase
VALAQAGFDVTVVDAAPSAVAMQRAWMERLGIAAKIEQADLFAWDPGEPFDAVYDQTCLCSLPPALWPNYVRRLHRWLRPDGALFVLFVQNDRRSGPPFHCDIAAMRRLFAEPAWQWPDVLPERVAHPSAVAEQPAVLRRRA